MFVTKKFVFLHIPKTGGTFIHKVLRDLHCPSWFGQRLHSVDRRWRVRIPFYPYQYREYEKHWIRRKIPTEHQHLPCMLAFRHPLDYYVSAYKFGWWRNFPDKWFNDIPAIVEKSGPLLEMQFEAWMEATLQHSRWAHSGQRSQVQMGGRSAECVRYLVKDITAIESLPDRDSIVSAVQENSRDVTVLTMENLNRGLHAFLSKMGFPSDRLDPILEMGKVFPGSRKRPEGDSWSRYYSPDLARRVAEHEWLLFRLNPEYVAN